MPGRVKSRSRHLVWPLECDSKNSSADENVSTANPNCFSKSGNDSRTDSSSSITDTSGVPANTVMRVSRHSYRLNGIKTEANLQCCPFRSYLVSECRKRPRHV